MLKNMMSCLFVCLLRFICFAFVLAFTIKLMCFVGVSN